MSAPRFGPVLARPARLGGGGPGAIPVVPTTLSMADTLARWKARWGIGRSRATVEPGLYAVGRPGPDSPVMVSCNYRMSFDLLRRSLDGLDTFILVLDTRGVNVWCSAGKGSFGTAELVRRIASVRLGSVVGHRVLILPQLAATGVSAVEVKRRSGFSVRWGPVRAADIRPWLEAGMVKAPGMARVRFGLADRLVLGPIELAHALKPSLAVLAACLLLALPPDAAFGARLAFTILPLGASLAAGTLLFPALLPLLPFRAFSLKGLTLGLAVAALWWLAARPPLAAGLSLALACAALVSFLGMQFTGSTTFTNLRGVRLEVKYGAPAMAAAAVLGALGLFASRLWAVWPGVR